MSKVRVEWEVARVKREPCIQRLVSAAMMHSPISLAASKSSLLMYTRAEIRGRDTFIFPDDPSQPSAAIPNRGQGSGFGNWRYSPRNWLNHSYLVETRGPADLIEASGLAVVGEALRNRPTPGNARPATPEGTSNNVGPVVGPNGDGIDELSTWLFPDNWVYSFTLASPRPGRVSEMVLNYTQHGRHTLDEGFVLRYARLNQDSRVTLVSYGEGNAAKQSWLSNPIVNWKEGARSIWDRNQQQIFNDARQLLKSRT